MEEIDFDQVPEPVNTPCPSCGKKKLVKYPVATSPDDYEMVYECKGCKEVWD